MSQLAQMQRDFAKAIRNPDKPPSAVATLAPERLQVYQELFFNNVRGFIDNAFPVLHSLYPAKAWLALQTAFFRDYACHSPYFLHIAEQFVSFLQQYTLTAEDPPFLAELAHYEWAELYVGTVKATQAVEPLAADDVSTAALALSELALLSAYQFPVQQISKDFQPSTPGELQCFLIYRDLADEVIFVSLNQATLLLLNNIQQQPGQPLSEHIQQLAPMLPQLSPAQLTAAALPLLQQWATAGAIVRAPDIASGSDSEQIS
ncbi:HvfC family RiPP maturation protein [Rheinheimera sp. UJ63]|uniref:HvfC family RiPP maturation protein n=1 Tax=Rheinheimera sp. UJ63 TaxID=2910157 RepID=UPI001F185084|nr:putative DNA-binding domain-containing protein [Rheinheimera sp. UJ63]MCF4010309.1 putative DNA-binding domain-containing protein [Rheinheimera sp. UJ63]